MDHVAPRTPQELAEALGSAGSARQRITLGGAFTKNRMAGPAGPADVIISTAGLSRIIEYEPRDLTISVESGVRFAELSRTIEKDGLTLPLDPPYFESATVGGVVAANSSGPRRRLFGTCRDLIIGMKFATLEGKLIQSGGMVVKNVAGLDMAKLMVGSFGTLAAMAVVNFKLAPRPRCSRTFVQSFGSAEEACAAATAVLRGVLQPAGVDLLNPPAAARIGLEGFNLLIRAGGSQAVMDRYSREFPGALSVEGPEEEALWEKVREFTPRFLTERSDGAVMRVSSTLTGLPAVLQEFLVPVVARAGSGICYGYFDQCRAAADWLTGARQRGWKAILECVPEGGCPGVEQWPCPGDDFAMMEMIKQMFDPGHLLNKGRLYGRL